VDHGLWQPQAESPFLGSVFAASFPVPIPGSSVILRHLRSFYDPEGPETTLSQRGFHPPLSHWSDIPQQSRLLKFPILCSVALSLAGSRLTEAPSLPEYHLGFTSLHVLPSRKWSLFCSESCCSSFLRSPVELVGVQNGLIPIQLNS